MPLAKAVQQLKGSSSKWFNEQHPTLQFAWQQGFAAFTVGHSNFKSVLDYVRNQEAHHAKRDFASEFKALLERHGVEYDPKYLLGNRSSLPRLPLPFAQRTTP
jgi:putative transposase